MVFARTRAETLPHDSVVIPWNAGTGSGTGRRNRQRLGSVAMPKITKRLLEAAEVLDKHYIVCDDELARFAVRISARRPAREAARCGSSGSF